MREVAGNVVAEILIVKERWHDLGSNGTDVLLKLCNQLIETSFTNDLENWGALKEDAELQERVKGNMLRKRNRNLEELGQILDEMKKCVEELEATLNTLQSFCDQGIEEVKLRQRTCSIYDIEMMFLEIVEMYRADLKCKENIVLDLKDLSDNENRFNSATRDSLTFYITVWTETPFLDQPKLTRMEQILVGES